MRAAPEWLPTPYSNTPTTQHPGTQQQHGSQTPAILTAAVGCAQAQKPRAEVCCLSVRQQDDVLRDSSMPKERRVLQDRVACRGLLNTTHPTSLAQSASRATCTRPVVCNQKGMHTHRHTHADSNLLRPSSKGPALLMQQRRWGAWSSHCMPSHAAGTP